MIEDRGDIEEFTFDLGEPQNYFCPSQGNQCENAIDEFAELDSMEQ